MTIPEEIEQLKFQLAETTDEGREAELILELLKKYSSINSADGKSYNDRLLYLADVHGSPYTKGWGLFYLANTARLIGDYGSSKENFYKSIELFQQINDAEGLIRAHNNIGVINVNQGHFEEALSCHMLSLSISENVNDKQGTAQSYNNIGIILSRQGKYQEALQAFLKALHFREELNDPQGSAGVLHNIGNIHNHQGNYPEALRFYLRTLQVRQETGDKSGQAGAYNNIGNIYYRQGNDSEAMKNFLLSFQIRAELGDKLGLATSLQNIGHIHHHKNNFQDALQNYLDALHIWEEGGDSHGIASSLNDIGTVEADLGNYPAALKKKLNALKIAKEIGAKPGIATYLNDIGCVLSLQGNYEQAREHHLLALQIAEQIGNREITKEIYKSFSDTCSANHDFQNALKYFKSYQDIKEEISGTQVQTQLSAITFQKDMELKEKELEIQHLRNVELKKEKDRSENLLLNILPFEIAEELKSKGKADAKRFDEVTVLYTDFVGFTKVSERLTPQQLVDELNVCFKAFDEIITKYNIEKIKTMGDGFIAAAGLPTANISHAEDMIRAAIEIRDCMLQRRIEQGENTFEIRIGINSGPVVAGIVGIKKFAYDIWGDTVNTAARMEQNSEAGKINISQTTYELVKDKFTCRYRGEIEAKNKGLLKMYFVE